MSASLLSRPVLIAASALAGFTALLLQTYCIHLIFLYLPQASAYVALALSSFLAGMGLAALLLPKWTRGQADRGLMILSWLNAGLILYAGLVLSDQQLIGQMIDAGSMARDGNHALVFAFGAIICFTAVPAFCLGGVFPVLNGFFIRSLPHAGEDTGSLYFWDIVGCVAGGLLTGFVLIPYAGLQATLMVSMAGCAVLIFVFLASRFGRWRTAFLVLACLFIGVAACVAGGARGILAALFHPAAPQAETIFNKPSPYGTISVTRQDGVHSLFVNKRIMCVDHRPWATEKMIAETVLSHLPDHAHVLNIGLGCGTTAHAVAYGENVDALDIVDINPVIVDAYDTVFDPLFKLRQDKRVGIHVADGAHVLRTHMIDRQKTPSYDAIIIDIEEVNIIYSSPLYTVDYFNHARHMLKQDGVFAIWTFYINDAYMKVLYNSLKAAFDYVDIGLSASDPASAYFIASQKPIKVGAMGHEGNRIAAIMAQPTAEVNTLSSPVIQRYFDVQQAFGLPRDYSEKFMLPPRQP